MKNDTGEWVLTDDDSYQFVRHEGEKTYSLIEMGLASRDPDLFEVYADTIDVQDYLDNKNDELRDILSGFGYADYSKLVEGYGCAAEQVAAECIFEHYGSFQAFSLFSGPEDECRSYIGQHVTEQCGPCDITR